jgi:DUF4097 and DUF4098 domain-containing protein YvlB
MNDRGRTTPEPTRRASIAPICLALAAMFLAGPALADGRLARTFDLGSDGRFILSSRIGSVTVTGTAGSIVQVVVTSNRENLESRVDLDFEEEPGVVRLSAFEKEPKSWFWEAFSWTTADPMKLEYQIRVPISTNLEIDTSGGPVRIFEIHGTVKLETAGGAIGLRDLEGAVTAETAGGDITLERIEGEVRVSTSHGNIRANDLDGSLFARTGAGAIEVARVSGDVDVGVVRGHVKIANAGGRVTARSAQGSLEVGFAAGNQSGGKLNAMKGAVRVTVDRRANLLVDAHATDGRVRTNLPIRAVAESSDTKLKGNLGSGGRRLTLRSTDGPIVLNARQ